MQTALPPKFRRMNIYIALLCVAAFSISLAVSEGVFQRIPHLEDEHANYYQAKVFTKGWLASSTPVSPLSFFQPFVIDLNGRRFSKYPPGYSLILALGILLRYPAIINAISSALTILGVYLLTRDIHDETSAMIAACLAVLSPMSILLSGTFLPHTINITLVIFFSWAFFRWRNTLSSRRIVYASIAGALLGFSFCVRPYTAVAIGAPFGLILFVDFLRSPRKTFLTAVIMGLFFFSVSMIYFSYNWINGGSPFANLYTMWWQEDQVGFGHAIGNGGHYLKDAAINLDADLPLFYQFIIGSPAVLGVPLIILFSIAGIVVLRRKLMGWFLVMPPASLIIFHMAYWAHSGGLYGPRYYAEAMPFIWILTAVGLTALWNYPQLKQIIYFLLPTIILWNIAGLILPSFTSGYNLYEINRNDTRIITEAKLEYALVFVKSDYWTEYSNLSWLNEPDLYNSNIIFARDFGPETNIFIINEFPGRELFTYDRDATIPLQPYYPILNHSK
ncbi:MAG TPA: glycosyltransferase family 39 protein [Anaerolineaceae bacterium]